jgi:hypothetical protein
VKPDLARAANPLPARALDADENRALERAVGLSLTPQQRFEWLERTLAELMPLRGLVGRLPAPEADDDGAAAAPGREL